MAYYFQIFFSQKKPVEIDGILLFVKYVKRIALRGISSN